MKCKLNFWIDVAIYLLMGALLFSGFLMKFTMPPGTGGQLTILGFDRHGWGEVHFWIALALLIGVALHLYLHWCWIRITSKLYWLRAAIPALIILLILAVAAIALPHVLEPTQVRGGGERHGSGLGAALVESGDYLGDAIPPDAEAIPEDPCASCPSECEEDASGDTVKNDGEGDNAGSGKGLGKGKRDGSGNGNGGGGRNRQGETGG